MEIVGRNKEQEILRQCYESGKPELVAVYGRRRVGKTWLVRQFFNDSFDFYMTGVYLGSREEQLALFNKQLNKYSKSYFPVVGNWFDAFDQLKTYLSHSRKKRLVVFIDELPWLDTQRSRFKTAFEYFWNSWGAAQERLMLVVCGSATTWMIGNLIGDKGGLYNRITRSMHLAPFSLNETELYLKSKKMVMSRFQMAETYMAVGGIPYYLSLLNPSLSPTQNIDELFFAKDAPLTTEYDFLFRSLFKESGLYKSVVEAISSKNKGLTQKEIKEALHIGNSGKLSDVLNNLCKCDIISKYYAFGKVERDALFQITDPYIHFYLTFVRNSKGRDEHRWSNMLDNPTRRAWCGYAFEQVCLLHIPQIKQKLGITGVLTDVCSWNSRTEDSCEQIDMIIDRRDNVINLCEIKFSKAPYEITRNYLERLYERLEAFRNKTSTRKALHITMITACGLKRNTYSTEIQNEIELDDLFVP